MREVVKVLVAVAATECVLWAVGIRSWIYTYLHKWPWMAERYALIFPVLLAIIVFALRRWRPVRFRFIAVALSGAGGGLTASVLAFVLAQLITSPERAHFWNSLRMEGGVSGFLLFGGAIALFRVLGWLYGTSACMLALASDRAEKYFQRSSG